MSSDREAIHYGSSALRMLTLVSDNTEEMGDSRGVVLVGVSGDPKQVNFTYSSLSLFGI